MSKFKKLSTLCGWFFNTKLIKHYIKEIVMSFMIASPLPFGVISATKSSTVMFSSPFCLTISVTNWKRILKFVQSILFKWQSLANKFWLKCNILSEQFIQKIEPLQCSLSWSLQPHSTSLVLSNSLSLSSNEIKLIKIQIEK